MLDEDDGPGNEKTGMTVEETTSKTGTRSFMNMMINERE